MHERENKKKLVGDRVLVKHVLIIKILYLLISFFCRVEEELKTLQRVELTRSQQKPYKLYRISTC